MTDKLVIRKENIGSFLVELYVSERNNCVGVMFYYNHTLLDHLEHDDIEEASFSYKTIVSTTKAVIFAMQNNPEAGD